MVRSATFLLVFVVAATPARTQSDFQTVVSRAGAFVEAFQKDFGGMVAEERYEQDVRAVTTNILLRGRAAPPARAVLRSDFGLVRTADRWMPFRDVFERNGMPVRDRDDRLSKLFLQGSRDALDQARLLMEESARYNIGNVSRTINLPTMALDFLTEVHRPRFAFTDGGRDETGRILVFRETARNPTYIVTTNNRDLPATGRFWVEEESGKVLKTELVAIDTAVDARITVTYQTDPVSGAWVPARMEERYVRRGDPNEVRGLATYSNFRRFKVETTEEVAK